MPTLSRRCSPPERVNGSASARWARRRRSSSRSARACASASGTPASASPCSTSSTTRPVTNWCSGFWNTTPNVRATSAAGHSQGSRRDSPRPATSATHGDPIRTAHGISTDARHEQAGQTSQQRRLPRPGRAGHRHDLARADLEIGRRQPPGNRRPEAASTTSARRSGGMARQACRLADPHPRGSLRAGRQMGCQVRRARGPGRCRPPRAAPGPRGRATVATRCSTTTTVHPRCERRASTASSTASAASGSRLAVGSSSSSSCGPAPDAAATARSCCWPPLSRAVSAIEGRRPAPPRARTAPPAARSPRRATATFSSGKATSSPTALHHDVALGVLLHQPDRRRPPDPVRTAGADRERPGPTPVGQDRRPAPRRSVSCPTRRRPSAPPARPARP